jgi:hypothetical protein
MSGDFAAFAGKSQVAGDAVEGLAVLFFCAPAFDAPARGKMRGTGASQRQSEVR